ERAGISALHQELGEAALIVERDGLARRLAFRGAGVEPVLPAVGILVARRAARRGEPVRSLPSGHLSHAGAGGDQAVVERRAARAARTLVLVVRPVHRIEEP